MYVWGRCVLLYRQVCYKSCAIWHAITSFLANDSAAFIWKLRCHWLKCLWQHHIAALRQGAILPLVFSRFTPINPQQPMCCCQIWHPHELGLRLCIPLWPCCSHILIQTHTLGLLFVLYVYLLFRDIRLFLVLWCMVIHCFVVYVSSFFCGIRLSIVFWYTSIYWFVVYVYLLFCGIRLFIGIRLCIVLWHTSIYCFVAYVYLLVCGIRLFIVLWYTFIYWYTSMYCFVAYVYLLVCGIRLFIVLWYASIYCLLSLFCSTRLAYSLLSHENGVSPSSYCQAYCSDSIPFYLNHWNTCSGPGKCSTEIIPSYVHFPRYITGPLWAECIVAFSWCILLRIKFVHVNISLLSGHTHGVHSLGNKINNFSHTISNSFFYHYYSHDGIRDCILSVVLLFKWIVMYIT